MPITSLSVINFRNIKELSFSPGKRFNVIFGDNGAGKTSLLESIYYLSSGKSFRTHINNRIINTDAQSFSLHINKSTLESSVSLGLQRHSDGTKKIRFNGADTKSITPLAEHLPLKVITTHSYRFLYDGPKLRRQFIDWGVFHVKPEFLTCWKSFHKSLTQRNAALKTKCTIAEINNWNSSLCEYGERLNTMRKEYIEQLKPIIHNLLTTLVPDVKSIKLSYKPGWDTKNSLEETLIKNLSQDMLQGYTQNGPQRFDILTLHDGTPIKDFFSQGQQKMFMYALSCAQGILLRQSTGKMPIYLIDDLPSEIDQRRQDAIFEVLDSISNQLFVTAIDEDTLSNAIKKHGEQFHMKHGALVT